MADFVQHLINGIAAGTIYALVALGYTMVYGVLQLINFAHGDVMMVGTFMGYAVAEKMGREHQASFPAVVAIFMISMAGCALLGFVIERFAYRPLRDKPRLSALITAIGISFALSYGFQLDLPLAPLATFAATMVAGVALLSAVARRLPDRLRGKVRWGSLAVVTVLAVILARSASFDLGSLPGAAPRAFPEVIHPKEWLTFGDHDIVIWNWQVISLLIAVALMVGLQLLVYRTRFGTAMRAVSFDHRVAGLMGIPTDRVIAGTFMLGSALAACAGLLYAIKDTALQPLMGLYVGLKAFVAAVIGGIGHVPGAVAGALLLGLVEEFVVGYTSSSWRDAVAFGFLIVVLLVRPQGLFGRMTAEKV